MESTPYDLEKALKRDRKLRLKVSKEIAHMTDLPVKNVVARLVTLQELSIQCLREAASFTIPKMVRLRTKSKPAREGCVKNICGKAVPLRALPGRKLVLASPTKGFKAAVGK